MTDAANTLEWGETGSEPYEQVEFTFKFNLKGDQCVLKVPFEIPLKKSVRDLAFRMIASHSIPCYLQDELYNSLNSFIEQSTKAFHQKISSSLLGTLNQPNIKENLVKDWTKAYHKDPNTQKRAIADNVWPEVYHALIHSPALDTLLRLEYSNAQAMKDLVTQRDNALKELRDKQVADMEELVAYVGITKTDDDVNSLATRQLEESQMQEIYWSSALSELQENQKREYREWVLTVHERTIANDSCNDDGQPAPRMLRSLSVESYQVNFDVTSTQEHLMEESFTIYLGNQMKSMHNIRLVSRDVLDYCQCKTTFVGGSIVPQPHRLQTAMALYSESLSALILLVDDRLHTSFGIKKKFHEICSESTDFHFPDIDKQYCIVEESLKNRPTRTRSVRSSSTTARNLAPRTNNLLQTGDFYVTKHSNLAEVHAVFHLVTDESVSSTTINSRHTIMTGVRNIMLAAARHNVVNLIIPLLLVHEMGENLTVQWCMKRAELVFKCVKGFMMESLSWDGHEARTVQFVLPTGLSEDLFYSISNMLPSIFRVSTTLDLSNI